MASISIAAPGTDTPSTFQPIHLKVAGASDADNTSCPARFAVGVAYSWSVSPSGASLSPTAGTDTDFTAGSPGTYTVQLLAKASNGMHSSATQVLTVGACGSHPPSIASVITTAGGVRVSRPQVGQDVQVTASATDPDAAGCGDVISSYQWTVASAPAGSAVSAPAAGASFSFQADVAGTYHLTVVATDSFGLRSAPYTIALETSTCSPIVASLTPSNPVPAIGETITLTPASPSDTCLPSPVFSYAWSIVSAPRGSVARLSSPTGSPVSFTPDVIGAYSFAVTATDQASSSSAPAVAQVNAGTCGVNPPTLGAIATNPANGTFSAGQVVILSSALTDHNGSCGALTAPYRWSWSLLSRPTGSHATLASADASPPFVPDLPGSYQVSAQVTDSLGNVSQAVFGTLSTSPCGTAAPVANDFTASQTVPSLNTNAGQLADFEIAQSTSEASRANANVPFYPGVPIALSATYTDSDVTTCGLTQTVAFWWSLAKSPAGSTATILNPSSPAPSLVPDVSGDYDVQLTLTDSTGRSTTSVFSSLVPVGPCGIQSPVARIAVESPAAIAAPVSSVSIPIGSGVVLDGLPSHDADIDQLLLTIGNTPPAPAGAPTSVSGCGLSQTLSYHWTVTAAPAAVQPLSVVHLDLPNPSFTTPVAGNYDLILTVSDGVGTASAPISLRARAVGSATVVATPANGSFVVGPDNGADIDTTVLDSDGNPMAGLPISVAVSAGFTGNTLTPASGTTGSDGKLTALLTSTKAGNFTPAQTRNGETKTVQVSTDATVLGSVTVDFAAGPTHDIFWFVEPCDTPTGNVINKCGLALNQSPEVDGEDAFGNVVTAYVANVTLSVAQQPSGSTVNGTLTQPAGTPFDDLSVDTDGTYQLSASSGSFPSVLSNTFQGTPAPPNPPVITSSASTTAQQILVKWTGSQNNAGHNDKNVKQYHVFRATGVVTPPDPSFVDVGTVPSTGGSASAGTGCANFSTCGFLASGLADGTEYTYYVEADTSTAAVCTIACSNPSNTTSQFTMPAAVANLSASTTAQKSIQLTWTLPSGTISTLDVRRSTSATTGFATFSGSSGLSGTTTTFTDTDNGKSTNTQYFYEIRSNITGATAPATNPSSVLSVRTLSGGFTLPDVPGSFTTSQIKYNGIALTWTAVTGTAPVTYTITRTDPTTADVQTTVAFSGISATAFSDTNVYPNVNSYNYQIQAVNGGGAGAPTTPVLSVPTPAAPWIASNGTTLTGGWLNSLAVDFNGIVYGTTGKLTDAGSSGGVFKLSGTTWTPVNNGIPNGVVVTSVLTTGITATVLYAATSGAGVFTSEDDGLTWNPVTSTGLTNQNVRTLFVDSNATLWAGGDAAGGGGIFSLPFAATAWTTSLAAPTQTVQAFVEDPLPGTGNLWAQLGGGAGSTPQGGLYVFSAGTWTHDTTLSTAPADCSLARSNASSLAIDTFGVAPLNPAILYWGSELCGLLSRTATGTNWSLVASYTATEITRVVVFDSGLSKQPFIWVASAEASAANGVTFIQNPGPTAVRMTNASFTNNWEPTALLFDSNLTKKLYAGAGDGSGAYVSSNPTAGAGGTFTKTNNGLTNLRVSFVIRDSSSTGNVFAASDQFGVSSSTNAGATWAAPQVPPGCTGSIASLAYDVGSTRLFATCQGVTGVFVASFAAATNALTWGASPSACTGLNSGNFSAGSFVDTSTNPDTLYIATQGTPATIWTTAASGSGIAN
ncbi:MAG: Ig-like domain-containing protein, partial [Myxococcales bacterium]|nr:Ig-like domain-containing protein [Myxococcales bacterium]